MTQRMHRLLAFLAILSLNRYSTASAACLSLKGSRACPGFSKEYISTNATSRFVWYPREDIDAFDKALIEYINSQSNVDEFQAIFRCPGVDTYGLFTGDNGESAMRYHRSIVCADIIHSDENIDECYDNNGNDHSDQFINFVQDDGDSGIQLAKLAAAAAAASRITTQKIQPKLLCQSTCYSWVSGLESIVGNNTLCSPSRGINRKVTLESLRYRCTLPPYNGQGGNCINGDENEINTCGYQKAEDWCKFCSYAVDYSKLCKSIGIDVGLNTTITGSDGDNDGDNNFIFGNLTKSRLVDLEHKAKKEKSFRIASIALGALAGVCMLILLLIASLTSCFNHRPGKGQYNETKFKSNGLGNIGSGNNSNNGASGGIRIANSNAKDFADIFITSVGKPRQVIRHFFARREDEISLQHGDIVTLQMAFDDGWVVGKNVTTGYEGTFPLMCIMDDLPPTLPGKWSVLPETKRFSTSDQERHSSEYRGIGRISHPFNLEHITSATGDDYADGNNINSNDPNGTGINRVYRMRSSSNRFERRNTNSNNESGTAISSNTTPIIGTKVTRAQATSVIVSANHAAGLGVIDPDPVPTPPKETTLLGRLFETFSFGISGIKKAVVPADAIKSDSEIAMKQERNEKLKRRIIPLRVHRSLPETVGKPGRLRSFNVNHVMHVGIDNPEYPRPGDTKHISSGYDSYYLSSNLESDQPSAESSDRYDAGKITVPESFNDSSTSYITAEQHPAVPNIPISTRVSPGVSRFG